MAILPGSIKNLNTLLGEQLAEGGGGGGGSSDFSTAEVTIVDNTERNILLPFIVDDEEQELHTILNLGISGSGSYTVPLYKGSLTGIINEGSGTVSVSGDITFLPGEIVIITGDCTITISE